MTNFAPNHLQPPPQESDVFKKTVIFILVVSAAIFVMPAIAIILIADAWAIGTGVSIAINMTIGAAVFAILLPFALAASQRIAGKSSRAQSLLLQRDIALLQQEVLELRHQTLIVTESAEFSKQLLLGKERVGAEKIPPGK